MNEMCVTTTGFSQQTCQGETEMPELLLAAMSWMWRVALQKKTFDRSVTGRVERVTQHSSPQRIPQVGI